MNTVQEMDKDITKLTERVEALEQKVFLSSNDILPEHIGVRAELEGEWCDICEAFQDDVRYDGKMRYHMHDIGDGDYEQHEVEYREPKAPAPESDEPEQRCARHGFEGCECDMELAPKGTPTIDEPESMGIEPQSIVVDGKECVDWYAWYCLKCKQFVNTCHGSACDGEVVNKKIPMFDASRILAAEAETTELRAEVERLTSLSDNLENKGLSVLDKKEKAEAERDELRAKLKGIECVLFDYFSVTPGPFDKRFSQIIKIVKEATE